ncbi:MAG: InlB B-repeat-containing protein [Paludibacteraceae bacterium]|nr:InlB B-repeat-containing protein [Paludibacteraceae bacterium]
MKKITLFLVAMTMSLLSFAQSQMSGTYTVGTGGSYDYASMADAGMAIKSAEFTGDVTLLICTDLTETINTGIVNKSEYTLTIRPDKDENRTITYTTATDNTGPTGVFVIGGDMTKTPGTTIGWASVPTKNVIVDGAAEGKTTPRLKITNNKWGTNVLLYGDVQDVIIRNCILVGRSGSSTAYSLAFRSENYSQTSKNIGPKNCVAENCIIESASTQSQVVYCQGNQANSYAGHPTNITIRNCSITSHLRGAFLYGVNGMNIEGCTFNMLETPGGYMCHGILGTTVRGTINVRGNKFIKNSTKNTSAGEFGLQTITASGGADVWVIENNYFSGYDALASGTTSKESRLVGIRCGDPCEIRHNTFYMPKLTYAPGTSLVGTHAVALLWLAGSHKYPVQNNIFVCEETTANVSLIRGGLNENVTGNVFYHKGGNAAIVAAAPSCMIFADLETSYPSQAATSKWANVTFADAANGDLSLAGSSDGDLNLAVDRLAEVLTDINGTARREKTYAGAYEGSDFPAEVCTVTAIVEPIGSGTVEGMGEHAKGTSVTLTPVPSTGYEFVDWELEDATTSTDNPLTLIVNSDITVTANFAKKQYTLTVQANDPTKGSVALDPAGGIYEYETEVTLTATTNDGYEFVNWSNGSTDNPLTMTVTGEETITANFRQVLTASIALNAHPVRDYSTSIVGTMKRAIQNGENTIVLTHEANGTAHIYNIAHATKIVTEISQEGVVAVDPDNAGDFLAISDIALTADGKLVACNYMLCQNTNSYVDAGYKRGTTRFYIWDEIDGDPTLWFTSQQSVNYYRARVGYTMALKGTSDDAWVIVAGFNNNATGPARFDHYHIVNGSKSTTSPSKAANMSYSAIGSTYEISASPLADGNWVLDGELAVPTEFVESKDNQEMTIFTSLAEGVLSKKYNGATYINNYNDHHLMIAPYADGAGRLAGVKVLGITDGFANPTIVEANGNLANAIDATTAATTAYVDVDGDLTIYLIADGKVYTFSEKVPNIVVYNVTATAGEGGIVEGGGIYEEGTTATLTATPAAHYDFLNWTGDVTSIDNPLTITVNSDMTLAANFQEHAKYTITASATDNTMGNVTGSGTYYVGESVTLKATAKTGYYFTGWSDSNTDNPRTFTATENVALQANFAVAYPRVYAYDLDIVDNGDSYTFSFKPNTDAVSGNLLLYSEDGTTVVQTYAISTPILAHTATSVTLNKTDLPTQADIPWAIQLSGNTIPAFAETFADADYRFARAHAVVDNSPESEYFGRVYVADRRKTKSNSGVYVYNPDFTDFTTTQLGLSTAGYSRPAVGADGTLYLTGYTDGAEAGIFVVDPADLTKCTQFFNGTYDSDGLYKNNGKEIGSSTSGIGVYGAGKDAVLYTMMEDGSNANFNSGKQPIVKYQIGQANGTVLKQWSDEPTWLVNYPATGKDSYNFGNNDFAATAKGVWVSQNKSNPDDRPEIAFVDKTGTIQFMQNSKPSLGGGMTVNADNTALYIVEDSKILEYAITWNENTPSLTLSNTYPISLQYISTLSVDYAGNLIACAGTTYGTTDNNVMKVVCFTLPTNDNTCTTPAPKSKAIKKVLLYDTQNNEEILSNLNDSQTETVFVFRNLTGGMYNTLCLPFDVATLTGTPLEHTTVWQYNGATVKGEGEYKEIFLDFTEVDAIVAGQPYLVEPNADIEAPMEFRGVKISAIEGYAVGSFEAVTMQGVLHPTELQANDKSILFLVANNELAWANVTANMNGMRAYFKVNEPSLQSTRTRAYINRTPSVATDMENTEYNKQENNTRKIIYNNTIYILRGDEVYTIQGTKVK